MKHTVSLITVVIILLVSGCGSDDNTASITGIDTMYPVRCDGADTLTAEGSTSQQNAIALFNLAWRKLCPGKNLDYNPTGSGAGQQQFLAGHVDFTGSDSPLGPDQRQRAYRRCKNHPAWNLPLVFGALVLTYHLEGVPDLVLTPEVIAKIFTGSITRWFDPAITALNPTVHFPLSGPGSYIVPIFRSDSAGSTDTFQHYLSLAAPQVWTYGSGYEFHGTTGEGAQRSAGIIRAIQNTPGAIGYIERSFAQQIPFPIVEIDSGDGPVQANDSTITAAVTHARFLQSHTHDLVVDLDSLYATHSHRFYPLVLVSYEIVCSAGLAPAQSQALQSFLMVAVHNAQGLLHATGYIVLPRDLQDQLTAAIKEIHS